MFGIRIRMNWDAVTFDWNQVRAFLVTAEERSLSAAARALGQTQPTLSRQVAALERTLGVLLFERTRQSMVLTTAGRELLDHVRVMGDAAMRFSLAAAGQDQTVEGRVVIAATDGVAAMILPAILRKIRDVAPRIQIDIRTSIEVSDLGRREADIAIRHDQSDQPDLIVKKVGEVTAFLCASRDYLNALGPVRTLEDLSHAHFIGLGDDVRMIAWLRTLGLELAPQNFAVSTPSGVVIRELVRKGLGIAIMPHDASLLPEILPVLPEQFSVRVPFWLTAHRELQTSQRIRIVFDILANELEQITNFSGR